MRIGARAGPITRSKKVALLQMQEGGPGHFRGGTDRFRSTQVRSCLVIESVVVINPGRVRLDRAGRPRAQEHLATTSARTTPPSTIYDRSPALLRISYDANSAALYDVNLAANT